MSQLVNIWTSFISLNRQAQTVGLRLIKQPQPHLCVCVCKRYQCKQHGQHFLVDEILGEVDEDFSIVRLQSGAVHQRHVGTKRLIRIKQIISV